MKTEKFLEEFADGSYKNLLSEREVNYFLLVKEYNDLINSLSNSLERLKTKLFHLTSTASDEIKDSLFWSDVLKFKGGDYYYFKFWSIVDEQDSVRYKLEILQRRLEDVIQKFKDVRNGHYS